MGSGYSVVEADVVQGGHEALHYAPRVDFSAFSVATHERHLWHYFGTVERQAEIALNRVWDAGDLARWRARTDFEISTFLRDFSVGDGCREQRLNLASVTHLFKCLRARAQLARFDSSIWSSRFDKMRAEIVSAHSLFPLLYRFITDPECHTRFPYVDATTRAIVFTCFAILLRECRQANHTFQWANHFGDTFNLAVLQRWFMELDYSNTFLVSSFAVLIFEYQLSFGQFPTPLFCEMLKQMLPDESEVLTELQAYIYTFLFYAVAAWALVKQDPTTAQLQLEQSMTSQDIAQILPFLLQASYGLRGPFQKTTVHALCHASWACFYKRPGAQFDATTRLCVLRICTDAFRLAHDNFSEADKHILIWALGAIEAISNASGHQFVCKHDAELDAIVDRIWDFVIPNHCDPWSRTLGQTAISLLDQLLIELPRNAFESVSTDGDVHLIGEPSSQLPSEKVNEPMYPGNKLTKVASNVGGALLTICCAQYLRKQIPDWYRFSIEMNPNVFEQIESLRQWLVKNSKVGMFKAISPSDAAYSASQGSERPTFTPFTVSENGNGPKRRLSSEMVYLNQTDPLCAHRAHVEPSVARFWSDLKIDLVGDERTVLRLAAFIPIFFVSFSPRANESLLSLVDLLISYQVTYRGVHSLLSPVLDAAEGRNPVNADFSDLEAIWDYDAPDLAHDHGKIVENLDLPMDFITYARVLGVQPSTALEVLDAMAIRKIVPPCFDLDSEWEEAPLIQRYDPSTLETRSFQAASRNVDAANAARRNSITSAHSTPLEGTPSHATPSRTPLFASSSPLDSGSLPHSPKHPVSQSSTSSPQSHPHSPTPSPSDASSPVQSPPPSPLQVDSGSSSSSADSEEMHPFRESDLRRALHMLSSSGETAADTESLQPRSPDGSPRRLSDSAKSSDSDQSTDSSVSSGSGNRSSSSFSSSSCGDSDYGFGSAICESVTPVPADSVALSKTASVPLHDVVFPYQSMKAWYFDSLRPILVKYTDADDRCEAEARIALKLHLRDTWVFGLLDSPFLTLRPLLRLRSRYLRFVKRRLGHNVLLEQCFKHRWSKLENPYFHSNALRSHYTPVLNAAPYYHKFYAGQYSRSQLEQAIEAELDLVAKKLDYKDCFKLYYFFEMYDPSPIMRRLDAEQHPVDLMPNLWENEACEFWRDLRTALQMGERSIPTVRNAKPWDYTAILVALIPKKSVVNLPALIFPPPSQIIPTTADNATALQEYPFTFQEEVDWLISPSTQAASQTQATPTESRPTSGFGFQSPPIPSNLAKNEETNAARTTCFWNSIALDKASGVLDRTGAVRDITAAHIPLLAPYICESVITGGAEASTAYALHSKHQQASDGGETEKGRFSWMVESLVTEDSAKIDVALKLAREALQSSRDDAAGAHQEANAENRKSTKTNEAPKLKHRSSKANMAARNKAKSWADAIPANLTKFPSLRVVPLLDLLEHPTNEGFVEHLITPLSHIPWSKKASIVLLVPTRPPIEDRNWTDHGLISKADLIGPTETFSRPSSPCSSEKEAQRQDEEILLF